LLAGEGALDDLDDVTITNPQANEVLAYDGAGWINDTLSGIIGPNPSTERAIATYADITGTALLDNDIRINTAVGGSSLAYRSIQLVDDEGTPVWHDGIRLEDYAPNGIGGGRYLVVGSIATSIDTIIESYSDPLVRTTSGYSTIIHEEVSAGWDITNSGIFSDDIEFQGDVGIGTSSPDASLEVLSTTAQLQLSYDATDHCTFSVDTSGVLTITPSGASILNSKVCVLAQGATAYDDQVISLGNGTDSTLQYNTTQSADTIVFSLPATSNSILFCERGDIGYNFGHGVQTCPTMFLQSQNRTTTEWLGFCHDGTHGNIDTGAGDVVINGDPYVPSNYTGLCVDENAVNTTFLMVESFKQVKVFDDSLPSKVSSASTTTDAITFGSSGDYRVTFNVSGSSAGSNKTYQWYGFSIEQSGTTITGATQANPVVVTAVAHGLQDGDYVKISGVGGMVEINDQIFVVANKATDTFELNNDNSANIDGTGFTAFTTGGTASLATKTGVHSHRKFSTADIGSLGNGSIVTAVSGDTFELHAKCDTDTTAFLHEHVCFIANRLG
jgi:hypothetical protein